MGSVCCSCFQVNDPETNLDGSGSHQTCIFRKYASFFIQNCKNEVIVEENDAQRLNSDSSLEYEDVCQICLEEYTMENPKIILLCSHDYHLGCIYDWFERSGLCPACNQVMIFDETSSPLDCENKRQVHQY